jgi:hypothetical protein
VAEPIAFTTTRYRCPHCRRSGARAGNIRNHMTRCWFNPEIRGCKTCKHFDQDPGEPDVGLMGGESCELGVSLDGRPACHGCGGSGWRDISSGAQVECNAEVSAPWHVGDGREVKPGPIVGCDWWELAVTADA